MAEQPVASSAPETVVSDVPETPIAEAPAADAAPEASAGGGDERSRYIPRERFDETYARMKQAEELLTQFLTTQPAAPAAPVDEDPLYGEVKSVKQMVAEMRAERQAEKDARDREAFWKENEAFAPLSQDVENQLTDFRRNGYQVTREQVLDYLLGQKTRKEVRAKATAPRSPAPAINQVAHAESAPSSRRVGKDLSQMSQDELLEHERQNPGALAEYLRGKTF